MKVVSNQLHSMRQQELLKKHTTLQVGGPAAYFTEVASEDYLEEMVAYAQQENISTVVLGSGSNILVADTGFDGLVLHMSIKGIDAVREDDRIRMTVGAGEVLDDVVAHAVTKGYWGLENLSHIPGTVGAAPVQNVGAYGVEVKDCIESVRVYNTDTLKFEVLNAQECLFGYRESIFKRKEGARYIVTSVTFILSVQSSPNITYKDLEHRLSGTKPSLADIRNTVIAIREEKFPNWHEVGTAGSFFKNPVISLAMFEKIKVQYPEIPGFAQGEQKVKIPLGWVLDKVLHLKGEGTKTVGAYQGQALVLINKGDATADDFVCFAQGVMDVVKETIDVDIQWEVTKVGF